MGTNGARMPPQSYRGQAPGIGPGSWDVGGGFVELNPWKDWAPQVEEEQRCTGSPERGSAVSGKSVYLASLWRVQQLCRSLRESQGPGGRGAPSGRGPRPHPGGGSNREGGPQGPASQTLDPEVAGLQACPQSLGPRENRGKTCCPAPHPPPSEPRVSMEVEIPLNFLWPFPREI